MSTTIPSLPNPDTYLNHLAPAEATQFEVARNLYIAVLAAFTWDIVVYIPEDVKILRCGIRVVTVAFVFSRVFALIYILLCVVERTVPVAHCHALALAKIISIILAITFSTYLFLLRVQAVYSEQIWVKRIFFFLWLAIPCAMISVPLGLQLVHVPGTQYCVVSVVMPFVAISGWSRAVFDTLVFSAISYKVIVTHSTIDEEVTFGALISGKALPRVSRAILQGGQQYYLITVGVHVILGINIVVRPMPAIYKAIISTPALALGVSMACRVFRNIKMLELKKQSLAGALDLRFLDNIASA